MSDPKTGKPELVYDHPLELEEHVQQTIEDWVLTGDDAGYGLETAPHSVEAMLRQTGRITWPSGQAGRLQTAR